MTNRVQEEIFKPLFSDGKGAPNAPIRILVAMMALKEGPTESTYYLFRQKAAEHGHTFLCVQQMG